MTPIFTPTIHRVGQFTPQISQLTIQNSQYPQKPQTVQYTTSILDTNIHNPTYITILPTIYTPRIYWVGHKNAKYIYIYIYIQNQIPSMHRSTQLNTNPTTYPQPYRNSKPLHRIHNIPTTIFTTILHNSFHQSSQLNTILTTILKPFFTIIHNTQNAQIPWNPPYSQYTPKPPKTPKTQIPPK